MKRAAAIFLAIALAGCLENTTAPEEVEPCYEVEIFVTFDPGAPKPIATDSIARNDCP